MKRPFTLLWPLLLLAWLFLACGQPVASLPATTASIESTVAVPAATPVTRPSDSGIIIGIEYILIDDNVRTLRQAEALAPLGLTAAKHYAEHLNWDEMQPSPDAPIDFSRLDSFVTNFQANGFTELVVTLRSQSSWASVDTRPLLGRNIAPKPEYLADYGAWIGQIVERYDGDGVDDMIALLYPVRMYEIGSEFSSYEPEPVADYLVMLEEAYRAAHSADDDVLIAHAAFLTTLAFADDPAPADYPTAFTARPDQTHSLAEMQAILDRPDLFDLLNLHSLGTPIEIERMMSWLNYETGQRGYQKPVIISDTAPNPLIAWGPATTCDRPVNQMGVLIPPATESDRCQLASLFNGLLENDPVALAWSRRYVAEDMAKKILIAAEQNVLLINSSFSEDLYWQQIKPFQAGAGLAAWGGMLDLTLTQRRPAFYAVQQMAALLSEYGEVEKVGGEPAGIQHYELCNSSGCVSVIWYDADKITLPCQPIPTVTYPFTTTANTLTVESLSVQGLAVIDQRIVMPNGGQAEFTLSSTPIIVYGSP